MRPTSDISHNLGQLVDKKLGDLYLVIENVNKSLAEIKHVSHYMENLFDIHENLASLIKLSTQDDALNFTTDNIGDLTTYFSNLNTLITNRTSLDALADEIAANALLAQNYANAVEDTEVESGLYSAMHYAIKSAALKDDVTQINTETETYKNQTEVYKNEAETAAANAASMIGNHKMISTLADISNYSIESFIDSMLVMGGNEFGDISPFVVKRLTTAPSSPAIIHKLSFDGDWWEIPSTNGTLSTAQVGLAPDDSQYGSAVTEMIKWLAVRGDGWNGGQLIINPPTDGQLAVSEIEFNQQIQLDPRVNVRGLSTRTTRLKWTGGKEPAIIVGDEDFRQGSASSARQMQLSDFTLVASDGANQGHGLVIIGAPNSQTKRIETRGFDGIDAGGNGDLARGLYFVGNSAVLGEPANSMEAHYHLVESVFAWENGINIGVNAVLAQGQTNAITFLHCNARNARGNPAATPSHPKAYEHYHSANVHLMNCHNVRLIGGSREMGGSVGNGTDKARYGTHFGPGTFACYDEGAYYEGHYGDLTNPTPYSFADDATCYSNMVDNPLLSSEWLKSNPENINWAVDPGKRNEVKYRRHDFSAGGEKFKTKHVRAGGAMEVHEFDRVNNDHQTIFSEVTPISEGSYSNTSYARWGSDQAASGYKVDMPFRLGSVDPASVGSLNGSMWRHPTTRMPMLYETASQFGGNRAFGIHVRPPSTPTATGSPGMFSLSGGYKYEVEAENDWGRTSVTGTWS